MRQFLNGLLQGLKEEEEHIKQVQLKKRPKHAVKN